MAKRKARPDQPPPEQPALERAQLAATAANLAELAAFHRANGQPGKAKLAQQLADEARRLARIL